MSGYVAMEIIRQAPERVMTLPLIGAMVRPDDKARASARCGLLALAPMGRFKGEHRNRYPDSYIRAA